MSVMYRILQESHVPLLPGDQRPEQLGFQEVGIQGEERGARGQDAFPGRAGGEERRGPGLEGAYLRMVLRGLHDVHGHAQDPGFFRCPQAAAAGPRSLRGNLENLDHGFRGKMEGMGDRDLQYPGG